MSAKSTINSYDQCTQQQQIFKHSPPKFLKSDQHSTNLTHIIISRKRFAEPWSCVVPQLKYLNELLTFYI